MKGGRYFVIVTSNAVKPDVNGNLPSAGNVYSSGDSKFKYMYETQPVCNGKK